MRHLLLLVTILFGHICYSQHSKTVTPPKAYFTNISKGDSLLEKGHYKTATIYYLQAFEVFGWRGIADDRFKAAKAFALAEQRDSAFIYLEKLCKQQYINYLKLATDTAFSTIKQASQKWVDILSCIKSNKNSFAPVQNLAWSNYLDTIYQSDQAIRKDFMRTASALGWDSKEAKAYLPQMRSIDSVNQIKVERFINTYGWRGQDELGSQGNSTLFIVIQHSDSTVQNRYIPVLREAVMQKKARAEDLALMEDRLSMSKFGYQIYGSQIAQDPTTKKFIIQPINDEKNVNKRRARVGLQPLEEYVKLWGLEYKPTPN